MINSHRLESASFVPTVHTSGAIKPELIILHDTTGRLTKGNTVGYLKKNKAKVSYHVVIERDGTIVQMAPFNRRCHHAGRSAYKGRKWCNGFSIGIGMVNPGPLTGTVEKAKSWFGEVYTEGVVEQRSPYHGNSHLWLEYTTAQIESLNRLVSALRDEYGDLPVTGHYVVSPGRKVDPLPGLSFASLGSIDEPEPDQPIVPPAPANEVLAKSSRKYKANAAVKNVLGGSAAAGIGLEVVKAGGIQNIQAIKAYMDTISGFVQAYGVPLVIGALLAGWAITEAIQHWSEQDYEEGRYEPSAEADAS